MITITSKNKISISLKGHLVSNDTKQKISKHNSKTWKLVSPRGEIIEINNLREFSIKNGLSQPNLFNVIKGNRKSHKGWTKYVI